MGRSRPALGVENLPEVLVDGWLSSTTRMRRERHGFVSCGEFRAAAGNSNVNVTRSVAVTLDAQTALHFLGRERAGMQPKPCPSFWL